MSPLICEEMIDEDKLENQKKQKWKYCKELEKACTAHAFPL